MNKKIFNFIVANIILISVAFAIAFYVHNYNLKRKGKKAVTFFQYLNQGKVTPKGLFVSFIFGVVFGFMDNFFLWAGEEHLMEFLPGGTLTKSALGNTYSDFIGATFGIALASIGKDYIDIDEEPPIWVNAIAMPVGCILGLIFGKLFIGGK